MLDARDYELLLDSCDRNIVRAAYILARSKNRFFSYATPTPTLREVYGAMLEIATRVGWVDLIPAKDWLGSELRVLGLEVLP